MLILGFCGMANAAYLAQNPIGSSAFSTLFGISLANYGIAFFALIFAFTAVEIVFSHFYVRRAIQVLAALGLIASAYLIFVQIELVNATCDYCLASAGISLLIFIVSYFIEPIASAAESSEVRNSIILPPSV